VARLQGEAWADTLPNGVNYRKRQSVRQIYGVQLLDPPQDGAAAFPTLDAYCGIELIAEVAQLLLVVTPSVVVAVAATRAQAAWAHSVASPTDPRLPTAPLLLFADIFQPVPFNGVGETTHEPIFLFFIIEPFALIIVALLRMLLANMPTKVSARWYGGACEAGRQYLGYVLFAIMFLHTWMFLCLLGIIFAWYILASVLMPHYVPYGVAVVTIIVVARAVGHQLLDAAERLAKSLRESFDRAMEYKLERARARIQKRALAGLQASAALEDAAADGFDQLLGAIEPQTATKASGKCSAADIFAVLKTMRAADAESWGDSHDVHADLEHIEHMKHGEQEATTIDKPTFKILVASLDLSLTEAQLERLFTMADLDGTGEITQEEFEGAWDDLCDEFLAESVSSLGLSPAHIVGIVVVVVTILVLLIAFVLVMVGAWFNNSSIDAVFQSTLIATLGRGALELEKRSKKTKDSETSIVVELMGQAEADAVDE